MKIFFILGEDSGDMMGASILVELQHQYPQTKFFGLAGPRMEKLGMKSIFPIKHISIMGFIEVIPKIWKIIRLINKTVKEIKKIQPDVILSIDSPDFCFRVVKKISKDPNIKAKKFHLVAPSVWAYRPGRAKKVAKIYDFLFTLLPFEPPYFEKFGLATKFVGHHAVERAKQEKSNFTGQRIADIRKEFNISYNARPICITVGSRESEVRRILPEIIDALNIIISQDIAMVPIFLVTKNTKKQVMDTLRIFCMSHLVVEDDRKYDILAICELGIAKSGTNNLEMLAFGLSIITIYKANYLTYIIFKIISKVKFANLVNIYANKEIIPELIQLDCNLMNLIRDSEELFCNEQMCKKQIEESSQIIDKFCVKGGFAATIVDKLINL